MAVFNLPDDIFPASELKDAIIIHDYQAKMGSFKGKSILHRNAISLVMSGEKTMFFADKTVNTNEHEFHFLSAGNCLVSMDLSKQDIFKSILIFFDAKVLHDFYSKHHTRITQLRKSIKVEREAYISMKKDDFVKNFITSLTLLLSAGRMSMEMKLLKFEELMLHLLEKYPATFMAFPVNAVSNSSDLIIRKTVETNIVNAITIDELAFLCNMSVSTFKRRFQEIYGTSPAKWMVQQRMEIAANLLRYHQAKPSEVFHQVGYESHSSFSESFKQLYGVTPKEFQLQKMNA
jgi:AraC-like DNA-binding protein